MSYWTTRNTTTDTTINTLSRLTPFAAVLCVALAWTGCGDLEEDGASCDPSAEADCVCSDNDGNVCDPETDTDCFCSLDTSGAVSTSGQTSVTVTIASLSYDPATVNLQQGGSVTWVNNGNQQHVVRCRNDSGTEVFDELLEANGTYTHTFDMAGTYTIDDRLFSDFATLRGTIIVN